MRKLNVVALLVCACGGAPGQNTSEDSPKFEIASVKLAGPWQTQDMSLVGIRGGPGTADPGRMTFMYETMRALFMRAYGVIALQISGPSWMDDVNGPKYDIIAKVPPGATLEQANVMLQNLLVERFGLVVHHESKQMEIYEMVVGKGGSKLKESPEGTNATSPEAAGPPLGPSLRRETEPGGGMALKAKSAPVSILIPTLVSEVRSPIVDKTGLTGKYDFTIDFVPGGMVAIVQRDLGLRLEGKKAPVDVLVIDHTNQVPTEN